MTYEERIWGFPINGEDEMLTDQQIEAAARKLCELRGIDPDINYQVIGSALPPAIKEIRAADQVREAIASVTDVLPVCGCGHSASSHFIDRSGCSDCTGPCDLWD